MLVYQGWKTLMNKLHSKCTVLLRSRGLRTDSFWDILCMFIIIILSSVAPVPRLRFCKFWKHHKVLWSLYYFSFPDLRGPPDYFKYQLWTLWVGSYCILRLYFTFMLLCSLVLFTKQRVKGGSTSFISFLQELVMNYLVSLFT